MGNPSGVTRTLLLLLGLSSISYPACAAETTLTACPSDKTVIGGVKCVRQSMEARMRGQRRYLPTASFVVDLHGLMLNDTSVGQFNGTPDGVDAVAVAVVCGGTVGAQTEPVALSKAGDVHIATTVTIPKPCTSPTILVRERYEGKIGGLARRNRKVTFSSVNLNYQIHPLVGARRRLWQGRLTRGYRHRGVGAGRRADECPPDAVTAIAAPV